MARPSVDAGGGVPAILYTLRKMREVGFMPAMRRMLRRNACKTCALGMGGQNGGMRNELGRFPEVCKKSIQAQTADMQGAIDVGWLSSTTFDDLARFSPAQMERLGRLSVPLIADAGATRFRRASWDEALDRAAGALNAAPPQETFYYVSGRSSNEAAFLF
jgi:anaerobic selenocysteine-containing dehydrogenase